MLMKFAFHVLISHQVLKTPRIKSSCPHTVYILQTQNYLHSAFTLQKGICIQILPRNSYNNCKKNSDNEMLHIKSDIDYRDDVHINNRQSCDHVKSCRLESRNCPSNNNNTNDNYNPTNYYSNDNNDNKKET